MKKLIIISLSIIFLIAFVSCGEEKEEWSKCYDCTIDSWIGTFKGKADYFKSSGNLKIEDQPVSIIIDTAYGQYLTVNIEIPELFEKEYTGKIDQPYYIMFAQDSINRFAADIYKKGVELKITGLAKSSENKSEDYINIDFEAEKLSEN